MDVRFKMTPVEGPATVEFARDFLVDVAFIDGDPREVVVDRTGEHAIRISELLSSLPGDVLAQLVSELAVRMVAIAEGVA